MSKENTLILYGVPLSQPVRAVVWLMFLKQLPFEMVLINPGSKGNSGSRSPAFLGKNPAGTIPVIEEPENGFVLGEAHAIMSYLCRKHAWNDLYPKEPQARARVDCYLHYHHRTIRNASIGLVAPKFRKDLNIPQDIQAAAIKDFSRGLKALETGWLHQGRYLAGDELTIADIAAYADIGQTQSQFTNVFDFRDFPNVQQWLYRMATAECHDDVHVVLTDIGDISQEAPSMETIKNANKHALQVLKQKVAEMRR